ncbi:MAG: DNA mismatch repair protein MutS [Chloroflexota bacterium]
MTSLTPVRQQYLQIKRRYPDVIVFFRLGDFYETFDADAEMVSRELDIVLTSRNVAKNQRVPMAGVPHHAAEGYIARLIARGHKVAICDQVGEVPQKGLVHREVVRVVTPGTVVEPSLLDEKRNSFLAAVITDGERAGVAYVDITTGEFAATQLSGAGLPALVLQEIERLQPRECLVPDNDPSLSFETVFVTRYDAWRFELGNARQALLDHFQVASLAGFGCEGLPLATQAAGAVVQYLQATQKSALSQLIGLRTYSTGDFMSLDAATRRNLELVETIRGGERAGSLLGVLDATVTAMGGRLLRQWINQPLLDMARLQARLDVVGYLYNNGLLRAEIAARLKGLADLERLANRVASGIATPRDLLGVRRCLEVVPALCALLESRPDNAQTGSPLTFLREQLDACPEEAALISRAITDDAPSTLSAGGVIRRGYSAELDGILIAARDAKDWVANLERTERKRSGISSLKVGFNQVFGYYLEVSKSNLERVPPEYIRKQTLVNAERFITPELKEYESLILNAEERIAEIEARLFREVVERVAAAAMRLLNTARALARLDALSALAEVAAQHGYVRPVLSTDGPIEIVAGRHPVVERMADLGEPFVPNDAHLSAEDLILVITGPNMSGKSTFLRQVALIVLMAQVGSFVPAGRASIGLVDRIFTRIGAQDEIAAGRSTFMVEMVETANILNHATSRSLLILDEVGRGTSTYDGISIAWAVVEFIHNHPRLRAKTLFATHYHELTQLASFLPGVRNFKVAVAEEGDRVVFLRKVVPGGADKSYGIHVAQLAGLPRSVVHRAQEILKQLEDGLSRSPATAASRPVQVRQLPLFATTDPLVEELKALDVHGLTPLEAITKLYELHEKARDRNK